MTLREIKKLIDEANVVFLKMETMKDLLYFFPNTLNTLKKSVLSTKSKKDIHIFLLNETTRVRLKRDGLSIILMKKRSK